MGVRLRPLAAADGARVLDWRNRPEVARWMYTDRAIGEAEHAAWLERALALSDRRYWIVELEGRPAGLANLAGIVPGSGGRCDWAFYLADPATRGQGVGPAVEYLVLRHVFEDLGLAKLWCEVLAANEGVIRLHERFGFKREALYREHVRRADGVHDVVGLGLLAREWPDARAQAQARLSARWDLAALRLET